MENIPVLLSSSSTSTPAIRTRSPSRSPTRLRFTDDLLSDLSPAKALEAFTSQSGKLKASIEAATETDRAFGIRAALASKKIQEWVDELKAWPWPTGAGSTGFETPAGKRRKLSESSQYIRTDHDRNGSREVEEAYIGSLVEGDVYCYEARIEEITEDMDELKVEDIKRQVLDTHFSPRSRPSSSASTAPMPTLLAYSSMDDFTAIVTATVLQALPNLSKLMRLIDLWSIRLSVLRKVPRLLQKLDDTEVALKDGWRTIQLPSQQDSHTRSEELTAEVALSRQLFDLIRNNLQSQVTLLGQELDSMLDTLEGRQDTLPESWLDRMEEIEKDYGAWVVAGDQKVREDEWARLGKLRRAEEERKAEQLAMKEREEQRLREEETAEVARIETEERERRELEEAKALESTRKAAEEQRQDQVDAAKAPETVRADDGERQEKPAAPALEALEKEDGHHEEAAMQVSAATKIDKQMSGETEEQIADLKASSEPILNGSHSVAAIDMAITKNQVNHVRHLADIQEAHPQQRDGLIYEGTENSEVGLDKPESILDTDLDIIEVAPQQLIPTSKSLSIDIDSNRLGATPREGDMGAVLATICCCPDPEHKTNCPTRRKTDTRAMAYSSNVEVLPHNFAEKRFPHPIRSRTPPSKTDQARPQSLSLPGLDMPSTSTGADQNGSSPDSSPHTPVPVTPRDDTRLSAIAPPAFVTPPRSPFNDNWETSEDAKNVEIAVASPNPAPFVGASLPHGHSRSTSLVSNYSSSDSIPEIQEAETAHAFRPALTPTPSRSSLTIDSDISQLTAGSHLRKSSIPTDDDMTPSATPPGPAKQPVIVAAPSPSTSPVAYAFDSNDGTFESRPFSRRSSLPTRINTLQITSRGPEITAYQQHFPSSPTVITPSSPRSDVDIMPSFYEEDESSPSAGRIGSRNLTFEDDRPLGSPPFAGVTSHRRQGSQTPSDISDSPSEAPFLDNVPVTSSTIASPRKPKTTDHLQQQIHSILTTIPNDIRLTTEPPSPLPTDTLRPRKIRRSTPSTRASSSMSARSPTPYLTLAPVITTTSTRQRSQPSNPEIKLYHLSRSTGEKPIKLFVRLVGEHGERVMVRVGGGWADLGEYLKEYAIHHGRRSASGGGEVEIRDLALPSSSQRTVSGPSTLKASTQSMEKGGRNSPNPNARPASTTFDRPPSSITTLAIRKHRVSIGEADQTQTQTQPFTPSSSSSRNPPSGDTPDSATSNSINGRSSSRLGWTDDETSSLGLAGPKGKLRGSDLPGWKRDWVESMKERVRVASGGRGVGGEVAAGGGGGGRVGNGSAEKERSTMVGLESIGGTSGSGGGGGQRREKEKEKEKIGELEKIGATKRLFRRSGGGGGDG